ncbi:FAD-dependent oxidoreductase [Candidatus Sumerlaeota bacterium]|nr:FAD-dependent oxidoreductase [Candidatus Sumerlaeota bacterium]
MNKNTVECDVLVVGGGAAGIAAAVGAAGLGGRVLLLERYGFLGGMATAGMVGTVCGAFLGRATDRPRYACGGFVEDWTRRLARASSSKPVRLDLGLYVLPYDPWVFRRLADETLGAARRVETALHATLTDARVAPDGAIEAEALVWNRRVSLRARALVDCSGEAVAVAMAGGALRAETGRQAPAVLFAVDGATRDLSTRPGRVAALKRIARACRDGRLAAECSGISFLPWAAREGPLYVKLPLPNPPRGDWNRLARLETTARERIDAVCEFLRKEVPAFRKARLSHAAAQVGIRTGLRAQGESTLTARDVIGGRKRKDAVARGVWPVEEWGRGNRPRLTHPPEGDWYDIPAGCLVAKGFDTVFMAGRCLSAAEKALASCRVIGTALATGWAAGKLAASRALERPRNDAIHEIQRDMGAPRDF